MHTFRPLLAALALTALAALTTPAAATDFRLDNAVVVGSGDEIAITRLPLVTAGGAIVYVDVTLALTAGSGTTLSLVPGSLKTTRSVTLDAGALTPGRYRVHGASPVLVMRLIGPTLGAGNRPMWSLIGESVGQQMNFYAGNFAGHPLQARLQKAGITWAGQAFGSTSRNTSFDGWYFDERQLVAIQPLGRGVALTSWSYKGVDSKAPLRTVTLLPCDAVCK
ncbi:hypothetical protein [Pinisolibacter sp.]|uniref:hypothetical protein n=1 Tax=Pinisolibacter sp. TaxID=2172024 RepID=UPI002FDEF6E3